MIRRKIVKSKTIAECASDPEIKNNTTAEADYFLEQSVRYGRQYEIQKEMLPEFFNADKPIPTE